MIDRAHRRYFQIGGVTVQVDSDLPMNASTFHTKFQCFEVQGPGEDTIRLRHRFQLPYAELKDLGRVVYDKPPWRIHRNERGWTYLGVAQQNGRTSIYQVARFSEDHTEGVVYHDGDERFRGGGNPSLTFFPTDQILLGRVLARRDAFFIHAAGAVLYGKGYLFVGRSGAGKSTTTGLLGESATILCDDRMIVRQETEGFRTYGTWSHGDVPAVSGASAPLSTLFFLCQAKENRLVPISDRKEVVHRVLDCLVRPAVDADWWKRTLAVVERLSHQVTCRVLEFSPEPSLGRFIEEAGL